MCMLLAEKIESDGPHSSDIFGGMVFPDAAAVVIACDIQGPMPLMLHIPMLAHHRHADRRRPDEARTVDAIIAGHGSARVGGPNRFDDNHRLELRPLRQLRKGCEVGDGPDAPPHGTAVRVIEGIKAMLAGAPGQVMFEVHMAVLFESRIGLCVIALQGQAVVPFVGPDLPREGRLAAHGLERHHTACEGEQVQEVWNRGDLSGLRSRCDLAHDQPTMIGTPGGEHRQRGRSRRSIQGSFHRFAIQGDEGSSGERRNCSGPGQTARLKALGIEAGKDAAKRIMGGEPMREGEEGLEPRALALTKELHSLEAFSARQERAQGNDQDIEQEMLRRPFNAGVVSGAAMLDNRRVHGVSHGACSSPEGAGWEQHSIGWSTEVKVSLG
jgi:hypothetical protein